MATSEFLNDSGKQSEFTDLEGQRLRGKSIAGVSLTTPALRILNDAIVIGIAAVVSILIRFVLLDNFRGHWVNGPGFASSGTGFLFLGGFVVCYSLAARKYGLYAPVPLRNGAHETRLIMQAALTATLFLCGAIYMLRAISASRLLILIFFVVASVFLSIRRAMWRHSRYRDYEKGIELRNVLVLGTNRLSGAMGDQIERQIRMGYNLCGFIDLPESREEHEVPKERILGTLHDLRKLVRGRFIDELVIAQPCSTKTAIRLIEEAHVLDVDLSSITGYFPDLSSNAPLERIGCYPLVLLHRRDRRMLSLFIKRIVDIVLSFTAIVLILPLVAAIVLAIVAEGRGPVFYASERIGKRGRTFNCFKFRTMVPDAEALREKIAALNERDGILFKAKNDPRITPMGKFLRKYSLDELPQFFNVLRGEMSIVGPRPPIASEVERYELDHLRRLDVLPGLTGLWQIQARQNSSFARYIELDTAYIENWSFWLDLTIIMRTFAVVLRGTGA